WSGERDGKDGAAGGAELGVAATIDIHGHHGRAQRRAIASKFGGRRLESLSRTDREVRRRQQGDAGLSVLASGAVWGAESGAGGIERPSGAEARVFVGTGGRG